MNKLAVISLALLLVACGDGALDAVASGDVTTERRGPPSDRIASGARHPDSLVHVPSDLSCVSQPEHLIEDPFPTVWRLRIAINGDRAELLAQRGPQFLSHGGRRTEPGEEATPRSVSVSSIGVLHLRDAEGELDVTLTREGFFFVGALVEAGRDTSLVCWSEREVFGSPWTGEPGAFKARHEWETGRCVDAAGREALNQVPIELVRETGYGECADLRGVALNGEDSTSPDLQSWFLAGAELGGARLFFASLSGATLNGADLGGLAFGYAEVSGSVDGFTVLPKEGACVTSESPWAGTSVNCQR